MSENIDTKPSSCFFRLTVEGSDSGDLIYEIYIDIGSDYHDDIWSEIGTIADEYENTHEEHLVREIKYMGYITRVNQ